MSKNKSRILINAHHQKKSIENNLIDSASQKRETEKPFEALDEPEIFKNPEPDLSPEPFEELEAKTEMKFAKKERKKDSDTKFFGETRRIRGT
jgi:hypothetical protein